MTENREVQKLKMERKQSVRDAIKKEGEINRRFAKGKELAQLLTLGCVIILSIATYQLVRVIYVNEYREPLDAYFNYAIIFFLVTQIIMSIWITFFQNQPKGTGALMVIGGLMNISIALDPLSDTLVHAMAAFALLSAGACLLLVPSIKEYHNQSVEIIYHFFPEKRQSIVRKNNT